MIVFVLANSADTDEMPHYVAFHLGLHCLPKYMFRSLTLVYKGSILVVFLEFYARWVILHVYLLSADFFSKLTFSKYHPSIKQFVSR